MQAWSWIQHHRWLSVLFLAIVVIGTAGGTAWAVFFRTVASPVSLRDALRLYRSEHTRSLDASRLVAAHGVPVLASGVYRYRTTGGEALSLPGANRSFPSQSEIIVSSAPHGCTTMNWVPIVQHTEATTMCPAPQHAVTVSDFVTDEQISGSDTNTVIDCPDTTYLVPPLAWPGVHWSTTCHQIDPSEPVQLIGTVLGSAPVSVDGTPVPALHVRLTMRFSGVDSGTSPMDFWISTTKGVLLREQEVSQITQSGVHYTERMDAVLSSLSPAA